MALGFISEGFSFARRSVMPSVRISGNWRNVHKMELAGTVAIDAANRLARSLDIPEEAYVQIENAIRSSGGVEGTIYLPSGTRFDWFLDR
jgi:hypothetical protein